MTAVHKPLLEPTAFLRSVSHFTKHPGNVRPAESGEADLGLRVAVRTTRVRRHADGVKHKERHEMPLIEHVRLGPGGKVSPTMRSSIAQPSGFVDRCCRHSG